MLLSPLIFSRDWNLNDGPEFISVDILQSLYHSILMACQFNKKKQGLDLKKIQNSYWAHILRKEEKKIQYQSQAQI